MPPRLKSVLSLLLGLALAAGVWIFFTARNQGKVSPQDETIFQLAMGLLVVVLVFYNLFSARR
jgi:hypothetical protein